MPQLHLKISARPASTSTETSVRNNIIFINMATQHQKLIKLDGRVGEGGGQLVRVAISLAAITGTPVRIDHVRGNREGSRGGGESS